MSARICWPRCGPRLVIDAFIVRRFDGSRSSWCANGLAIHSAKSASGSANFPMTARRTTPTGRRWPTNFEPISTTASSGCSGCETTSTAVLVAAVSRSTCACSTTPTTRRLHSAPVRAISSATPRPTSPPPHQQNQQ
ncbi:UNVERIFIED_CONTAM: hypothetical protein GTU68_038313 [Idotea baltica]|nr:hypothetical protein [Idotea baltica]